MEVNIVIALIGVISVLAGTFLGGFISYLSNKNLKQEEWYLSLLQQEINELKKLYSDYLAEASRLEVASVKNKINDLREFNELGTIFSQIELLGSQDVINAAKQIGEHVLYSHTINVKKRDKEFYEHKSNYVSAVKKELLMLKAPYKPLN